MPKSELDKSVDLSLCSLPPAQSQMDLFLDTLCARNKQRAPNFNQSEEAMSRVTRYGVTTDPRMFESRNMNLREENV